MSRAPSSPRSAIVVGSGPNGLAAAITLAQAGARVRVIEGAPTLGGGCRSAALTLPGFVHDVCSAIHPLTVASPFFTALDAFNARVDFLHSPVALAHPLDDGTAVAVMRDLGATAGSLGRDADAYRRLLSPIVHDWPKLRHDLLAPLTPFPRNLLAMARFGPLAALPAETLARAIFRGERARAVFAGMAAHSMLPLSYAASAAYGLLLSTLAHAVGWPMPRGGAQSIADALAAVLRDLGGEIETGRFVRSLDELPADAIKLLDVTPRQLLSLAGDALPAGFQRKLRRFQHGPGVFKIDYALSEPIPWTARECSQAATVHLGGTLDEIAASERAAWRGEHCDRPFVLLAQHTLFDPSRAPAGRHTLWAYCHAPRGSTRDMTAEIERQIERFAPGFRDCVIARHVMNAVDMERHNPNYIGGDINGGAGTLWQTIARPTLSTRPYHTPLSGVYLCSQSTPPGGGVHGMCGVHAARAALVG